MNLLKNRLIAFIALISLILSLLSSCFSQSVIDLDSVPEFSGTAFVVINGNEPFFEDDEITDEAFESYSELDALGEEGRLLHHLPL